jgi:hypothetical protein
MDARRMKNRLVSGFCLLSGHCCREDTSVAISMMETNYNLLHIGR